MKKVGISAGHYWDEPGKCTPDGYKEINFNMACKKIAIAEAKRCGLNVIDLNPTGNEKIEGKAKIANANKVDAAVEIHYNAFTGTWGTWGGVETLCHIAASSTGGKKLARDIHSFLIQGTKMADRGINEKNWIFCGMVEAPAAMVECGFMDNKREAELMRSPAYIKECAIEVVKGLCKYLNINYIKYVPEKTTEKWEEILKEVSAYSKVWIKFVEEHQNEVNLKGLIEKLYYYKLR